MTKQPAEELQVTWTLVPHTDTKTISVKMQQNNKVVEFTQENGDETRALLTALIPLFVKGIKLWKGLVQ